MSEKQGYRFDLTGEFNEYFDVIKSYNQFQTNVEVFRHALKSTYEMENDLTTPYTILPKPLKDRIRHLVRRRDIQMQFGIHSLEDVIRKGVDDLLVKIDEHIASRSVLHWDVRSQLAGDHKDVALAIREWYVTSKTGDFSLEELLEVLGWKNKEQLQEILNSFVQREMLEVDDGIYHATNAA